jgi:hypothetical protein
VIEYEDPVSSAGLRYDEKPSRVVLGRQQGVHPDRRKTLVGGELKDERADNRARSGWCHKLWEDGHEQ